MSGFAMALILWYSEITFQRLIETEVKEFNISIEFEFRKGEHFRERSSSIIILYGETIQLYGISIHYECIG